ncbi:hypothetical protein [Cupriavidus sp. IDO]|uniref:hypothetical protein n=1 Tax=Cupriavidus sp. IDO TaxID=1539142 RepID=UPI000AFFBD07|nr:hypothetical protein [Cupriavidus sp. IDO]
MTRTFLGRPATVLLILGLLACSGCERSQPGPKPISGNAAASTGTGASGSAIPTSRPNEGASR